MGNITVSVLGKLLAEEIIKNFEEFDDNRIESLVAEFEDLQDKATARALLDDKQITFLENRIACREGAYNLLNKSYDRLRVAYSQRVETEADRFESLGKERDRFKSAYQRVAEQKEKQINIIHELRAELYQTQTRLTEIRRVVDCV